MMRVLERAACVLAAVVLFAACAAPTRAHAALPSGGQWRRGVNYSVISPVQPTAVPAGKVEVLEMFWLACPHCDALEPYVRQWLKTKPGYIDFVRVPVTWDPLHRAHARLYYTLEALGRDDLAEKAFAELHAMEARSGTESVLFSGNPLRTLALQQSWAARHGIRPSAFASAFDSFYVNTEMQTAARITDDYRVDSVPFFAVGGRYATDPAKAGGESEVFSVVDFLAASIHRQQGARK
jgi:thiol:disulfide interchange protein DsbA